LHYVPMTRSRKMPEARSALQQNKRIANCVVIAEPVVPIIIKIDHGAPRFAGCRIEVQDHAKRSKSVTPGKVGARYGMERLSPAGLNDYPGSDGYGDYVTEWDDGPYEILRRGEGRAVALFPGDVFATRHHKT
jgi:hypothetical protein